MSSYDKLLKLADRFALKVAQHQRNNPLQTLRKGVTKNAPLRSFAFGVKDLKNLAKRMTSFGVLSAYKSVREDREPTPREKLNNYINDKDPNTIGKKENQERHGDLLATLNENGLSYETFKASWQNANGTTTYEKSVLIPMISYDYLYDLSKRFKQEAFIYKDPSGTVGIYSFKDNTVTMAYDEHSNLSMSLSTDRNKEYSKGRNMSFGLNLVDEVKIPWDGGPVTHDDLIKHLEKLESSNESYDYSDDDIKRLEEGA